jgi:LCP family protein required for cell wall assembly
MLISPQSKKPASTPRNPRSENLLPKQKKRSWIKRILFIIIIAIAISSGIFGYKIIAAGDNISSANRSILGQLKDLFLNQDKLLTGEENNRVNVLLMAIGGEGHKGKNLADTIMVASIDPSNQSTALLSIPRDLYVQVPNEEYFTKINAVHAYGESQKYDHGPELLREMIEEITDLPIHYYVRVDFTAFKGIVDSVGGINITNENSFYDYWHKISFPAGTEKMNGERTLAFVRARYIEGPEGGDFKRAARQQQVLMALRQKVFSVQTALDFSRINGILNSLSENIRTDMQLQEMKRFYELGRLVNPDLVHSVVLTTGPKGVLVGTTKILGGTPASVLHPRTGDYSEIQQIAKNIFDQSETDQTNTTTQQPIEQPPSPTPTLAIQETPTSKPSLEIRNSTSTIGLAKKTSDNLKQQDYEVVAIGNATTRDLPQTNIYVLSPEHQISASALSENINANIATTVPENEPISKADILIILGQSAAE